MRTATRLRWLGTATSTSKQSVRKCGTLAATTRGLPVASRTKQIGRFYPRIACNTYSSQTQSEPSATTQGPLEHYDNLVKQGTLRKDDFQRSVAEKLQDLYTAVTTYEPPSIPEPVEYSNIINRWRGVPASPSVPPIPEHGLQRCGSSLPTRADSYLSVPKGIYLFGDVGCGKTMLMDLFCNLSHLSTRNLCSLTIYVARR